MNNQLKITELDFGYIGIPKVWSFGDSLTEIERKCGEFEPIMKCKINGYIIHFENKLILLDTGLHLDVIKNPFQSLGADIYDSFPVFCGDPNYLTNQIEKQGCSMQAIDYVLISHIHFDHAGALESIVNSKLIASPESISLIMKSKTDKLVDKDGNQMISILFQQKLKETIAIISVEKSYLDLFNDGRFLIFRTDGHVEGHLSVVIFIYREFSKQRFDQNIYNILIEKNVDSLNSIETFEKFKENILTCDIFPFDAVFSDLHYENEAISKYSSWNLECAINSLKLIKKLGNLPNSKIYFSHPPC